MKIKPKKVYPVSSDVQAVIDAVLKAPPNQFAPALSGFEWTFDKGDFNQWIALINFFDDFLEKNLSARSDLQLDWTDGAADVPFPQEQVLAILRTTATILDNCSNKHLYQSTEHLSALLAAPDQEVVDATLSTLMALVKRSHSNTARFATDADLNKRLLSIAQGWGGEEQGLGLVACSSDNETSIQQGLAKATELRFKFYKSSSEATREDQIGLDTGGELCTVQIPAVPRLLHTPHQLLQEVVQQYDVPQYLRFKLLSQIRVAKRFGSLSGRICLAANRLMAFIVYMQSNPSQEEMVAYFVAEPEFVSELVNLVEAESHVVETVRTLALRALAVQLLDRHRHGPVITALSAGGQSGLLATLMRSTISGLTEPSHPQGVPTTTGFAEALFSLISALVASTAGCTALASAGLIPAFLPMLSDQDNSHLHLVTSAVRIMETYMDFVTTASTLFRDLGGLSQMIGRLNRETQAGAEPLQPGTQPAPPPVNPSSGTVPFQRRNLIKFLLRAIALASYSPGSGARPQEQDQEELFKCLRRIMEDAKLFGGTLFSLAASVMTDLIHHDPLVFRVLDQAGLPQAFIDAIKAGIIPSGDAITCVPTALVAICLNSNGARKVKATGALDSLVPVLTTPAYIKALSGETLGGLGTGLDELMRHVPTLRESVIEVFIKILHRLIMLGDGKPPPANSGAAESSEGAADAVQPMETDSAAEEAGPSSAAVEAPEPTSESGAEDRQQLGEMVQRTARVLEALVGNVESGRLFVQRNGIHHLIPLYNMPKLAPSFGSHSPLHAVTSALRILAQSQAKHIAKPLALHLKIRLESMLQAAEVTRNDSVPLLPEAQRDSYTRELQMTEGVLGLAASLSRMSVDLLAEISTGDQSITLLVSQLERIVVKQTTVAQDWKLQRDAVRAAEATKTQGEDTEGSQTRKEDSAEAESAALSLLQEAIQEGGDNGLPHVEPNVDQGTGKHKKRTNQECSYDALIQLASTARCFYVQIGKAIHNPSRRREEVSPTPCLPMQAAAAVVSTVMRDALTSVTSMWPELRGLSAEEACRSRPAEATQLANYITHMVGGLGNTMFDARRRTCHSLILNYFVAGSGLEVLLGQFNYTVDLLDYAAKIQQPALPPAGKEERPSQEKLLRTAVEGSVRMFLQLLDHLVNGEQLLNSPQAANLLLRPLPGSKVPPKHASSEQLVTTIQAAVMTAVMRLWTDPDLAASSPEVAQRIVSILTKCINGTTRVTPPVARAGARPAFQPDASVVRQIAEMGFPQARAEEALRRVQHNSVELAMEWLINHPEEAAPEAPAAQENDFAARFTSVMNSSAEVLNAVHQALGDAAEPLLGGEPRLGDATETEVAATSSEPSSSAPAKVQEPPQPEQLVEGAVNMLAKAPTAAFALSDLLSALCRQNNKAHARAVLQRLIEILRGSVPMDKVPTYAGRSASVMLAPTHLLALLTTNDPTLLPTVHELEGASTSLDLLETLLREHLGFNPPESLAPVSQITATGRIPKMPKWVDALLLVLDQAIKVQPAAEKQQQQATGIFREESMAETPDPEGAREDGVPAAAAGQKDADPAIAAIHNTIRDLYSSGGLLSDEEQLRAAQVCICLLNYLHIWAPTMAYTNIDQTKYSDPASHAQAVLQLLARLTKKHSIAQLCLHSKVHKLLLTLPPRATSPELTAHMCAIMRHLLEDPATLQCAMEAEIRSTLAPHNRSAEMAAGAGGMPLRLFLTNMATVIGRDPTVFFEALLATCFVSKDTGRAVIKLKQPKVPASKSAAAGSKGAPGEDNEKAADGAAPNSAAPRAEEAPPASAPKSGLKRRSSTDPRTPRHKEDAKEAKSALKPSRKAAPASFVEVIETLVDYIYNHQGSPFNAPEASPVKSDSQLPAAGAPALMSPGIPSRSLASETPPPTESQPLAYNSQEHSVLIQCIALKMLTDFTLMYTSTVGIILRRDTETKVGSPKKTPRKEQQKNTGLLLRHIMRAHLASDPEPGIALQSLAQQASYFLLAVSIRSAEGRRRIVSCIVEGLAGGVSPEQAEGAKPAFKPPLYKVKALVELITSLMCITTSSNAPRTAQATADHFHEMMRAMVAAGVRKALLQVLKGLDVNHPKAPQLINTILKPFEVLTRSFLWRGKGAETASGGPPAQAVQAPHQEVQQVAAEQPQEAQESLARNREAGAGEGDARHSQEESAAGPDALAAAHQAMQRYDRQNEESDVDPQHARDLEDMVEAIMEQAYAEDMLDEYGSDGSEEPSDEEMDGEGGMEGGELSADEVDGMIESGDSEEDHDEDDEDDEDDDMSDDYSSDESDSISDEDHGMNGHEAVVLEAGDPGDEEDAFLEGEEDEVDEEEHLILDGPDFNAIDNAFQQGLDGEPPVNDEDENGQYEDNEGWEEDEEEEEDEDDIDDAGEAEDNGFWEAPEDETGELEWDLNASTITRGPFGGLAGLQHPTQAVIEELFGSLGRVGAAGLGLDRRRYQVITHQLQPTSQQRPRRPAQHMLLQRPPATANPGTASQAAHRELHPMATALINQLGLRRHHQGGHLGVFSDRHGGGYLVFPDGRVPGAAPHDPRAAGAAGEAAQPRDQQRPSPLFTDAIDMLLGSSGSGGRQDSRMANWSDDGLPPPAAPANGGSVVAGTLEHQLANVLLERPPPQMLEDAAREARAAEAAPAGQAAPGEPEPSRPAGEAPADPQPAHAQVVQEETPVVPQPAAETEAAPVSPPAPAGPDPPLPSDEPEAALLGAAAEATQAEPSDQEMADASPSREEAAADAETSIPRAADIEMGSGPVDPAFLDALPAYLRAEMLAAQAVNSTDEAAERPSEPPGAERAVEPGTNPEPAASPAAEDGGARQQEASGQSGDEMEGIDPEFIAALPPDLQAEVLEQQRRERRLRQAAARRAEAQQQAAARAEAGAAAPAAAAASDMDMATILATFPPEVREEVLLTSDDTLLASLTPALLAEAQNLRERVLRASRDVAGVAGGGDLGGLGRSLLQVGREPRPPPANPRPFRTVPFAGQRRQEGHPSIAELAETERYLNEEGPPPIDDADVEVLVNLMRLPQPLARQVLQRIFTNLCGHRETRRCMLRLLVSLLHGPMMRSTGTGGSEGDAALQPVPCKRFLDMLIHLARYKPRAAQDLPPLLVPIKAPAEDAKGKSIAHQKSELPAIEILFGLLSSTLCERSNSHLISTLNLLELVMSAAQDKTARAAPSQRSAPASSQLPIVPELPIEEEAAGPSRPETAQQAAGSSQQPDPGAEGGERPQASDAVMEPEEAGRAQPQGAQSAPAALPQEGASSSVAKEREVKGAAAREAVGNLPREHIEQVVQLLGWQRASEAACTRIAAVALLLVECAPQHRDLLLAALDAELQRCGQEAATELQRLADSAFGSRASQAGGPVLRLLQTLTAICKPDASQGLSDKQRAALDASAERLEGLWSILSQCIARIEDSLGKQTPQQEQAHLLPPEAAQVLPFVEAFFVLCDARTAHLPQPEPGMLRAASSELARTTGLSQAESGPAPGWPKANAPAQLAPRQRGLLDAHLPFLRFAEKHRRLLNALLRQHPNLLEGSLAPLLRVARLVDFDNKRAYFRTKVRTHGPDRHYGSLRINVRRDHVFEDSFHQLRVRSPEEMRAKLSVHFQGEEGIDAGGVSREWYQVMAREMFNPNFSLFVPVPEGGSTFQPNPNSIVQNDEARGTNHLDFFKFVGRVVGKALYDGFLVDAYFTRSLYKHMLDQPLTYMDIEAVDPEYFKNLAWMLENDITDVLDLTFTEEVDYFGRKEIKELKPGGKDVKVTEANKREYVDLITQHHMTTAIRGQLDSFLGGFWDLIPKELIKIFNDHELELLISGLPEIDIDDLRSNTEYQNFTAASPTIQWFWELVRSLEKQDLALLVQFVTGTSKVPLEGFKALQGISGPQKFQIHKAYGNHNRLPSAHTCFNQLDLIEYDSKDTLKSRLLTAIREGSEGFGFG